MATLHESIDFAGNDSLPRGWEEDVFRFCTFSGLDTEGRALSGIVVECRVKESDWYWGLFNVGSFVRVEFRGCVFRGCTFAGCVFAECRFVDCRFEKDNLDGDCTFRDCAWHGCEQAGCVGLPHEFARAA